MQQLKKALLVRRQAVGLEARQLGEKVVGCGQACIQSFRIATPFGDERCKRGLDGFFAQARFAREGVDVGAQRTANSAVGAVQLCQRDRLGQGGVAGIEALLLEWRECAGARIFFGNGQVLALLVDLAQARFVVDAQVIELLGRFAHQYFLLLEQLVDAFERSVAFARALQLARDGVDAFGQRQHVDLLPL